MALPVDGAAHAAHRSGGGSFQGHGARKLDDVLLRGAVAFVHGQSVHRRGGEPFLVGRCAPVLPAPPWFGGGKWQVRHVRTERLYPLTHGLPLRGRSFGKRAHCAPGRSVHPTAQATSPLRATTGCA